MRSTIGAALLLAAAALIFPAIGQTDPSLPAGPAAPFPPTRPTLSPEPREAPPPAEAATPIAVKAPIAQPVVPPPVSDRDARSADEVKLLPGLSQAPERPAPKPAIGLSRVPAPAAGAVPPREAAARSLRSQEELERKTERLRRTVMRSVCEGC